MSAGRVPRGNICPYLFFTCLRFDLRLHAAAAAWVLWAKRPTWETASERESERREQRQHLCLTLVGGDFLPHPFSYVMLCCFPSLCTVSLCLYSLYTFYFHFCWLWYFVCGRGAGCLWGFAGGGSALLCDCGSMRLAQLLTFYCVTYTLHVLWYVYVYVCILVRVYTYVCGYMRFT